MLPAIPKPQPYEASNETAIPWHTTFVGQLMQHNFWLYQRIDQIFEANHQISAVVEIGTGSGASATVLGLWGLVRGVPVITVDTNPRHNQRLLAQLRVAFQNVNCFSPAFTSMVDNLVKMGPILLMCDGGNKQLEFDTFVPRLKAGSIITAHDLGIEFFHETSAKAFCDQGKLRPFQPEKWMAMNSQLAVYSVVD